MRIARFSQSGGLLFLSALHFPAGQGDVDDAACQDRPTSLIGPEVRLLPPLKRTAENYGLNLTCNKAENVIE